MGPGGMVRLRGEIWKLKMVGGVGMELELELELERGRRLVRGVRVSR